MVKCETVDLEVPAEAEFVLEGKVLPHIREHEGRFGESTGVYLSYENPVVEIDAITHRKAPIYQALMPFTMEGHVLMGISFEAESLKAIQKVFPQVVRAHSSALEFGQLIVQIDKKSEDDPKKIIDYTLDLAPYTKSVVVVDQDVDINDPRDVAWAMSNRFQPDRDIVFAGWISFAFKRDMYVPRIPDMTRTTSIIRGFTSPLIIEVIIKPRIAITMTMSHIRNIPPF